jgi:pectate lyase
MTPDKCIAPRPNTLGKCLPFAALLFLLQPDSGFSATWYVATNGDDSNLGTSNSPLATIMEAQSAASSGDTVWLRGGTYFLNYANVTATNNPWVIVNNITKNGISYLAFPGELPIFNFTNVLPVGYRVTAFHVTANSCVFRGFDVVGVQVTIQTNHTQSECFRIDGGSNNLFDQLRMHDGMANGWYLTGGSSNLVLNCDAYNNKGLDSGSIGNTDGFGCHPSKINYAGNVLRGCRSWFNSDDGYDCINAFTTVTFSNCWSFYNGYWTNFSATGGDGNGFKAGGYGVSGATVPNPIPRHVVEFCLAVKNAANGFYSNHHMTGSDWFNNTSYSNSVDFNMLCNTNNDSTTNDVPGFSHVMKNNLGYKGRNGEVSNLDTNKSDVTFNFFTLPVTVAANDFMSLDLRLLTAPRQTNGDLPYISFAQLVSSSDLVDAGTNIGFAYSGSAPDLGAFEYGEKPPPALAAPLVLGTSLIFTCSGGPAGGTNYLLAATNIAIPSAQWNRAATNKFDSSGNYSITNAISSTVQQQFYRISLP